MARHWSVFLFAAFVTMHGETPAAASETSSAKNSVFLEGLGAGLVYSINYERMVRGDVGVRVGFSYLSFGASISATGGNIDQKLKCTIFPITANYLGLSSGGHTLELGAGPTFIHATSTIGLLGLLDLEGSGMFVWGTLHAGYRHQPIDGGFQFRMGVSSLVGPGLGSSDENPDAWGMVPWGYISLGGAF